MSNHPLSKFNACVHGNRYTVPIVALAYGLALLVLQTRAGNAIAGAGSLSIMLVFAAVFVFGGRSETIRGLRGDGRDERIEMIGLRATAFAGFIVILVVIGGFLVELARGHDGSPYIYLGFVGGLAYMAAIVYQRFRS